MCAAVIPGGNPAPVLEPTEVALDTMPLSIQGLVVWYFDFSTTRRWDAWSDSTLDERGTEPIAVVSAICDQVLRAAARAESAPRLRGNSRRTAQRRAYSKKSCSALRRSHQRRAENEMRCIDHQPIRHACLACQGRENAFGDPAPAPADKAIVQRLGWPVA
jgi:hypothetical protein